MAVLDAAVRPFAGSVPHRAATATSDASERVSGKKRPRHGVAPARDSAACLTKNIISSRTSVVTAAGEMSSHELLQKRLASELGALSGLMKKAELISRAGGACKGDAPTASKKEQFLASNSTQRPKPIEEDSNAPSVKRRKISAPVEQKQIRTPPRMSPGESKVDEESKDDEEGKGKKVEEEYADISGGLSHSSGDSDTKVVQQSTEVRKVQDAQKRAAPKTAVDMRALLYRANLRRQQLEMERAALPVPDHCINPRELQRLAILASRSVAIRASCASSGSSSKSTHR